MGYDGTGQFTRLFSWQAREAANVGIVSDEHDQEDDNFAQGFNLAFCRDGQSAATGHWDLANHRIGNLAGGTSDGDAVNLAQLTGSGALPTPDIRKSLNLIGSDANGRINFMSATGVNGIGWFGADLSFLARLDEDNKTRDRLVMNNLWNGGLTATPGTDVLILDDAGNVQLTSLTYNLSQDTLNNWRTIAPGTGMKLGWTGGGLSLMSHDTPTVTDPYVLVTLRSALDLDISGGSTAIRLRKKDVAIGAAESYCSVNGYKGANLRWEMQLGTSHTETAGQDGSHFYLSCYNNDGSFRYTPLWISRLNGKVAFTQGISGPVSFDNLITTSYGYIHSTGTLQLGGVGGVYLRPNGYASATGQMYVDAAGHMHVEGIYERAGETGSYGTQRYNSLYSASNDQRWYVGTSIVGYYTPACDHRIKREIAPLTSMWDAVKKLIPVTFKAAAYGEDVVRKGEEGAPDTVTPSPFKDEETVQMGFLAHQLQDALGEGAATGTKDGEIIQGPNVMHVVAALTSALQEAMLKIEALEAKLA